MARFGDKTKMKPTPRPNRSVALLMLLGSSSAAMAGRPLTVDDAGVNDAGHGHVEAWVARADHATTTTVSPAYAFRDGMEIAAALSRTPSASETASAVQLKWRITPSQDKGCNVGVAAGVSHVTGGGTTPHVNGLFTCNHPDWGALHLNAGGFKPRDASTLATWGVAVERPWSGVTLNLEAFGAQHEKPTVAFGLRSQVTEALQLDGSVGRKDGRSLASVGLKVQF